MLTLLMQNNSIFQNQNLEQWHCFTFLQNSVLSGLIENSWILVSATIFNLLQYQTSHSLWKTPLYTCERKKMEQANNVLVYECSFDLSNMLSLGVSQESQDQTLRTTAMNK